jgi:hypothetical protein
MKKRKGDQEKEILVIIGGQASLNDEANYKKNASLRMFRH